MLYSQPRWYFEPYHCQDYILATYLYWYYANPPAPSLPSGRRCIECFWCPFVFYHHHPLPLPPPRHERVPTFRFSINWLDYSSHSNQLARYTRLFALVIEIIIGPGDIYIYIYRWFGISELLCRYHVPSLVISSCFGIIVVSILSRVISIVIAFLFRLRFFFFEFCNHDLQRMERSVKKILRNIRLFAFFLWFENVDKSCEVLRGMEIGCFFHLIFNHVSLFLSSSHSKSWNVKRY